MKKNVKVDPGKPLILKFFAGNFLLGNYLGIRFKKRFLNSISYQKMYIRPAMNNPTIVITKLRL